MKKLAVIALLASASSMVWAASDIPSRDAVIARIEQQFCNTVLTADSPVVASVLTPARQANPNLNPDEWRDITKEASVAISESMTQRGGMLDTAFRAAIASLSDAELKRLETLLSDPTYRKFSAAMTSPATQQKVVEAVAMNGLLMQAAVNGVLARHGLKELH